MLQPCNPDYEENYNYIKLHQGLQLYVMKDRNWRQYQFSENQECKCAHLMTPHLWNRCWTLFTNTLFSHGPHYCVWSIMFQETTCQRTQC